MELEFRDVHIDLLALTAAQKNKALTQIEIQLIKEYSDELYVTRGVVLAKKGKQGARYTVTHGAEVVRSAQKAGIEYIPCLISDTFTETFLSIITTALEKESEEKHHKPEDAIRAAIDKYALIKGQSLSFRQAEKLGKLGKKSTLYTQKRLAKNLHPKVQALIQSGKIGKSAGRSISYISRDEQYDFALNAIKNGWTVRDIDLARSKIADAPISNKLTGDVQLLQAALEQASGYRLSISPKTEQTGTIKFYFYGAHQLENIAKILGAINSDYSYKIQGAQKADSGPELPSYLEVKYTNLDLIDELKVALGVPEAQ